MASGLGGLSPGRTVAGEDFNRAMLRIWLGPKPPTEDLKNRMLGR